MPSVGDPYKVNIAAEGNSFDRIAESLLNISNALEGAPVTAVSFDGTVANNISTSDDAAFSATSSLDLRCAVALEAWTPPTVHTLIGKFNNAGTREWELIVDTDGRVGVTLSTNGTANAAFVSTESPVIDDGAILAVRAVWSTPAPNVKIYTKPTTPLTSHADLMDDAGWTQLGTTITASVSASIFASSANVTIGERMNSERPCSGSFFAAVIKVNGSLVGEWDGRAPMSMYRDSTGKLWYPDGSTWAWTVVHPSPG